jgi:hypothetical protein
VSRPEIERVAQKQALQSGGPCRKGSQKNDAGTHGRDLNREYNQKKLITRAVAVAQLDVAVGNVLSVTIAASQGGFLDPPAGDAGVFRWSLFILSGERECRIR